jgi:3'-5' exoribonuclease
MLQEYGEQVRTIPAAKSVHHSFLNGLLMHTLSMLKAADFLAAQYSEVIDRNLLIAGTLLHDFAKCDEFTTSPLGLVTDYSVKGQLLGHPVMGAQAVACAAAKLNIPEEKSALLQHMILSHHGEPEYGAAVRPVCAESELLSYIDMIDSRMEIYRETLSETPVGEFSQRIFALDRKVYHHN